MMDRLVESLPILLPPLVACLAITALHCYVGLHVVRRGVIFVDLALSQCAALGAAFALLIAPMICQSPHDHHAREAQPAAAGAESDLVDQLLAEDDLDAALADVRHDHDAHDHHHHSATGGHAHEHGWLTYSMSLAFALLGAVLLAVTRLKDERVPHEAFIGIIFVVCASLSVLILSKAPHGHEKMEAMLVGSILFVQWAEVRVMLLLYLALAMFYFAIRKPVFKISQDVAAADAAGMHVRLWDCLFYGAFAFLVTHSVSVAGVFVVFSYLIIPPVCASLVARRFGVQLVIAWAVAVLATIFGLSLSAVGDMPTGASLVSCFGAVLLVFALLRGFIAKGT